MINKKGFISISVVYSFFIVFLSILVLMMTTYVNNRITYDIYKNDIKEQLAKNQGVKISTDTYVANLFLGEITKKITDSTTTYTLTTTTDGDTSTTYTLTTTTDGDTSTTTYTLTTTTDGDTSTTTYTLTTTIDDKTETIATFKTNSSGYIIEDTNASTSSEGTDDDNE